MPCVKILFLVQFKKKTPEKNLNIGHKKGPAKELASVLLLICMGGGFYTHYALNDSFERMAPSLIFGLLIVCRLIILQQVSNKEKKELEMLRKFLEDTQSGTSIEELLKNGKDSSVDNNQHHEEAHKNGGSHLNGNGVEKKKVK